MKSIEGSNNNIEISETLDLTGVLVVDPLTCPPCINKEGEEQETEFKDGDSEGEVSLQSTPSGNKDICRICHCEAAFDSPLFGPCLCTGTLQYVHQECLQQWVQRTDARACELCRLPYVMTTQTKPFSKWEMLEMSRSERRRLVCSVAFHCVAVGCVIWSLYVLLSRSAWELQAGLFYWPLWTKLAVAAAGGVGSSAFMYLQCRAYMQLFRRWRALNRTITIHNGKTRVSRSSNGGASVVTTCLIDESNSTTITVPPIGDNGAAICSSEDLFLVPDEIHDNSIKNNNSVTLSEVATNIKTFNCDNSINDNKLLHEHCKNTNNSSATPCEQCSLLNSSILNSNAPTYQNYDQLMTSSQNQYSITLYIPAS